MGADTLVPHRLPAPTATTPPKPERKAVAAPPSPTSSQHPERVGRKDQGWFWLTRKRNAGPLTFTRPSVETGSGPLTPAQPVDDRPSLSRASSGESWLEVTRDDADAGGSSDDLTDLEDQTLVSIAPRSEPVVRSIRITTSGSPTATSTTNHLQEDRDAAPAGSLSMGSSDAPEPTCMQRSVQEEQAPVGIRMRSTGTKGRAKEPCSGTVARTDEAQGTLSMARVAAACGVAPDSDLLWTFLAGMMLYFMSV